MKMINISDCRVIDSHCHAFLPEKETRSFEQYFTLADHLVPKEDMVNTFIYRQVVRELSRVLNFDGDHEKIIEERNRVYKENPRNYINHLFKDVNIDTLLVDTGYPSEEFSGYSIDLKHFSKIVPCKIKEIFRIDNVLYNLLKSQTSFELAKENFNNQVNDAVKKGAVSLKTVIAYRTGLEIRRHNEGEVKTAYKNIIEKATSVESLRKILFSRSKDVKKVFDYFVFLSLEDSVKHKIPLQIHVGMGDAPFIDLRLANPILLHDLINDPSAKTSRIVLTHGGYPWIEEAGFLVNTYPNVFIDLSETIPFISIGIKNKLLDLFEMAPTNKLMYGSDGYNLPELHWISSILTKKALQDALNGLIASKEIDEDWAEEIARQILAENAKRIYDL